MTECVMVLRVLIGNRDSKNAVIGDTRIMGTHKEFPIVVCPFDCHFVFSPFSSC